MSIRPRFARRRLAVAAFAALTAVSALAASVLAPGALAPAQAAELPRQITIVVPFPPGGVTDQLARAVGQRLAENLKIPVVVDNRPGGGAQIAANAIKQGPADGSMIFIGDIGAFALNQSLYSKLSYDSQKDFTPLARLALAPSLLVVPASSPLRTVADFVAAARNRPVSIASQSAGSGGHLFAELIREQAGLQLNHIAYRGSAPALIDLAGGQVEIFFDPMITSGPFVKDGKLRAIAIGAAERSPRFPDVPTLKEAGQAGANVVAWFAMAVKAGTPPATVDRLGSEVVKAIEAPDVSARLTDLGLDVEPLGPTAFRTFLADEVSHWGRVIRAASIRLD